LNNRKKRELYKFRRALCLIKANKPVFRILIVGEGSVGKSTFLTRLIHNYFEPGYISTKDFNLNYYISYKLFSDDFYLQFIDLAGQVRYQLSFENTYFIKGIHGVLFLFDVTNLESLSKEVVERWMPLISCFSEYNIPIFLVGNKIDLKKSRIIKYKAAKNIAEKLNLYYSEISVKTGENITEFFNIFMISMILQRIKNLDKLILEDYDTFGYLTIPPEEMKKKLSESYNRIINLAKKDRISFGEIEFDKIILPSSYIVQIYNLKQRTTEIYKNLIFKLKKLYTNFILSSKLNNHELNKIFEKYNVIINDFNKSSAEIRKYIKNSEQDNKLNLIVNEFHDQFKSFINISFKYYKQINNFYLFVRKSKMNYQNELEHRIEEVNQFINISEYKEAEVKLTEIIKNFNIYLKNEKDNFVLKFNTIIEKLYVIGNIDINQILSFTFDQFEINIRKQIENVKLKLIEKIEYKQQFEEIQKSINDFIGKIYDKYKKSMKLLKRSLENDLEIPTIFEKGIQEYYLFTQKFNEFNDILKYRIKNTKLSTKDKNFFFSSWSEKTKTLFQTIKDNALFYNPIQRYLEVLNNNNQILRLINSFSSFITFNIEKYEKIISINKKVYRNLIIYDKKIKTWILNNIDELSLRDFSENKFFIEKMFKWYNIFELLLKKNYEIEKGLLMNYSRIHEEWLNLFEIMQTRYNNIFFKDIKKEIQSIIKLKYFYVKLNRIDEKTIIKVLEFMMNKNEIYGTINKLDGYIDMIPYGTISPSLIRMSEVVFGIILVKVGVVHRGMVPINEIKIHLIIPNELGFIQIMPFNQIYDINYSKGNYEIIIEMNTLYKGEKKSISLSFESFVCGKMIINGYVSFKNPMGSIETEKMDALNIEVICPSFDTDSEKVKSFEDISKYFWENTKQWRYYPIPNLSFSECLEKLDTIILGLNVLKIKEVETDKTKFEKYIWYYGTTKIDKREFVIRIEISEIKKFIKLEVAGKYQNSLIGILTRISDSFSDLLTIEKIVSNKNDYRILKRIDEKLYLILLRKNYKTQDVNYIINNSNSFIAHNAISSNEIESTFKEIKNIRKKITNLFTHDFNIEERKIELERDMKLVGEKIYSLIFKEKIRDFLIEFNTSLKIQSEDNKIMLFINSFESILQDFPWEFLTNIKTRDFFCLEHHIIRCLPVGDVFKSSLSENDIISMTSKLNYQERLNKPLKILIIASDPFGKLNIKKEVEIIQNEIEKLCNDNLGMVISVETLKSPEITINNIIDKIKDGIQIIHYCGHGLYDDEKSGLLIDASPDDFNLYKDLIYEEKGLILDSEIISRIFSVNNNIKLLILNACSTGRGYLCLNKTSGIAPTFIDAGVPYVLAMQFEISDKAGIAFSKSLYNNIYNNPEISIEDLTLKIRQNLKMNQYIEPCAFASISLFKR